LKREERLQHLTPQCGFIPPEPLEHAVIEIGEPLEAVCELSLWVNWICGRAVKVIAPTALGVSGEAGWNRSVEDAIEHVLPLFRLVWRLASNHERLGTPIYDFLDLISTFFNPL